MKKSCLIFIIIFIALPKLSGQDIMVPVKVQYQIFLKVLDFAKNLNMHNNTSNKVSNNADTIYLYIIYQSQFKESKRVMNEFMILSRDNELNRFSGKLVKIIPVEASNYEVIAKQNNRGISLLYIAPIRAFEIGDVINFSQKNKILTMTGVADYVEEGISIGVDLIKQQPKILINLHSAKAEGYEFSSQLLKLAKVIER